MLRSVRRYPEEFKRETVGQVRQGRSLKDVAESLGCSDQQLATIAHDCPRNRVHSRAFGYALLAVAAIAGPGLSFFVRALMFAVATVVGTLQLVWLERRGIRACVVATPAGICVFNGLRTHFVPWPEVEGFENSSRPFLLAIKRTKARPLPMAGLTPGSFGNRAPQDEDLERLECYRRLVTGGEGVPGNFASRTRDGQDSRGER